MENKSWKNNNTLRENNFLDSWKHTTYKDSPTEYWTYEANDIITLKIHKFSEGNYRGFINRTKYMLDHIAETNSYQSLDECREDLIKLVKEMCSGFNFL